MTKQNEIGKINAEPTQTSPRPKGGRKAAAIAVGILLIVIGIIMIAFVAYVSSYSRADLDAIEDFESLYISENIKVTKDRAGNLTALNEGASPTVGFIFYPGGKVEAEAYLPLMQKCAESGILCIIARMPCNLAFLNTGAARSIQKAHPEITSWYIGGHSLGGIAASSYLKKHADDFDGLILLGSYSTADLSSAEIKALTVRGTNDEVVTKKDHDENLENLPSGYEEAFVEGGCHAYFGMYGEQKGDGEPTVSPAEQITQTAYLIVSFINNN